MTAINFVKNRKMENDCLPERLFFGGMCLIVASFIVFLLASCSTTNHTTKNIEKTSVNEQSTSQANTDHRIETKTTTTETVDTTLSIPQESASGTKPLNELLSGQPMVVEGDGIRSELYYDSLTGNMNLNTTKKAQNIPVNKKKVTETTKSEVIRKAESNQVSKATETEKRAINRNLTANNYTFLYLGIGLIVLIVLFIIFRKSIPFIKNFMP